MNESTCQSLFFISLPDLRKLCAVTVVLNPGDTIPRDLQIKICRYLLFQHQDIVSSPIPGEQNKILVIMAIAFYKSGKVQAAVEKHGAKMEVPQRVTPAMLQTCLSYTLTAKLAPSWNKAGHLLVQGQDFLSQIGKQCAVVMDLNVSDIQLCISLQVFTVRLPPPQLVDFDISAGILKIFESNQNSVILRHFISSNWCYVLPSMKMGQIVSISHAIPPDSPFLSYENLQAHWKNLDIQCRPTNLTTKAIFRASLTQFPFAEKSVSAQETLVCSAGYEHKMGPLINQSRAYVLTNLSQPSQGTHANVTLNEETSTGSRQQVCLRKASESPVHSFGSLGLQRSSIAHFHSNNAIIIPSFKSTLSQVSLTNTKATNERKRQIALPSLSPTSSKIGKIMVPKLAEFNPDALLFHKPAPDLPVGKNISDAKTSNEKSSSRGFRFLTPQRMESSTHQTNPAFTNNSEINTAEVIQRQMSPPSLSKCISLQLQILNVNSEQRNTTGLNFHAKKKVCTANRSLQHYKDLSCKAESDHMSAPEMVTPWFSQGEKENHSEGRTAKDFEVIHESTLNSTSCLPNVGINDQEGSVLTEEDPTKEEGCKTKFKKSKAKPAIQDVDIENYAKNNQLSKLNSVTLQYWLKQHGISVKTREKKEKLVSKIMQFIRES